MWGMPHRQHDQKGGEDLRERRGEPLLRVEGKEDNSMLVTNDADSFRFIFFGIGG